MDKRVAPAGLRRRRQLASEAVDKLARELARLGTLDPAILGFGRELRLAVLAWEPDGDPVEDTIAGEPGSGVARLSSQRQQRAAAALREEQS